MAAGINDIPERHSLTAVCRRDVLEKPSKITGETLAAKSQITPYYDKGNYMSLELKF